MARAAANGLSVSQRDLFCLLLSIFERYFTPIDFYTDQNDDFRVHSVATCLYLNACPKTAVSTGPHRHMLQNSGQINCTFRLKR